MIPLRDENPSKTIPVVNTCLILTSLSVFVYQNFFVPGGAGPLILRLGFIPYEITNAVDLSSKNLVPVPLTILADLRRFWMIWPILETFSHTDSHTADR